MTYSKEEFLNKLHEMRVDVAKLPNDDPRKAERQALLADMEQIEKEWSEIDDYDPDLAKQVAKQIGRILQE